MGFIKYPLLIFTLFSIIFLLDGDKFVSVTQAEKFGAEQLKPELVMQTGHTETISAVVFSPDNKYVASGSSDNTVKIWEAASGRELRVLSGHNKAVKSIAWSSNGKLLASASIDKTVRLWNVETGTEIPGLSNFNEAAEVVTFSQNGRMIAAGSADQTIKIWDTESKREIKVLKDAGNRITALAFSPDGLILASGGTDNSIKIWEINSEKNPRVLKKHTDRVKALAFSPDGKFLASGAADNTVRIWNASNRNEIYKFTGHNDKILTLNFLSGNEIVSADAKRAVKFWNPAKGTETRVSGGQRNSDYPVEAQSAAFSLDGRFVVFDDGIRAADLFETSSGGRIETLENHVFGFNSVAFSPDKNWLAVGSVDNTIKLWDLQTGQSLPPLDGHNGNVRSVLFTPDSRKIISAGLDSTIKIWDFTAGDEPQTLGRHKSGINSIAVSRSGKRLASGGFDKIVKLWDLTNASEIKTLPEQSGEVTAVAFSSDENVIASGSADNIVKVWDLAAGKEILTLTEHTEKIEAVAFSPDKKFLASAGADKSIKVWDLASGKRLLNLSNPTGKVKSISFSQDGRRLASGSEDKNVKIWRIPEGQEEWQFQGHSGEVASVNFSTDGKLLASAGDDGSVNLWQPDKKSKIVTLISLRENNDWLVAAPAGFFDGSPAAWNQLLWRFGGDTFNFSPVEVFFNEFYQPGLLADLLAGKTFDAASDISIKDRRQPKLKISLADGKSASDKTSDRTVKLLIEVEENRTGGKGSGAKDARLFRNGSLVHFWNGDVLKNANGKNVLTAEVPVVEGQNQFTAYAFNNDNIKSGDDHLTLTGAENLKRKGTIYILGIGVGKYSNPNFDLNYVDADVKAFGNVLRLKQSELNPDETIKVFPLLDEKATKNNILETLRVFAGTRKENASLPFSEQPEKVQPEDTVIVYFSGHGFSHQKRFYMIPHDMGYAGKRKKFTDEDFEILTKSSVSDLELEAAFRGVDSKNLLLIIDACNSGQAIEAEDNRQGPMNSKGLAQLAYEKGMYVLTASQSTEDAYNSQAIEHSFLTYALVKEGLELAKADFKPADGSLLLREWFNYAEFRVPQLIQEILNKDQSKGISEVAVGNKESVQTAAEIESVKSQRPRIFYRRYAERQPLVVARFPAGKSLGVK
jgi:WD40 repeat protein